MWPELNIQLERLGLWQTNVQQRPAFAVLRGPGVDALNGFQYLLIADVLAEHAQLVQVVLKLGQAGLVCEHHTHLLAFLADELQTMLLEVLEGHRTVVLELEDKG
ncbi:hypothetical protein D3C81_2087090 [compost metagenome]